MCHDFFKMAPKIKVQTFFLIFWRSCCCLVLFGKIWAKMVLEVCFDLKKCAQHEKKCSCFFGVFFRHV